MPLTARSCNRACPKHGAPVSSIGWHTTVNHHPAQHNDHADALPEICQKLRYV